MGETTVKFPYAPGDKVKTELEIDGIVESCAIDGKKQRQIFLVKEPTNSRWYEADEITLAE